jgi:uncharacterized phage-like protein YoqJ
MQLWNLRPEYKQFKLKVFTQRIYQEIRRNKFINWSNKKRAVWRTLLKRLVDAIKEACRNKSRMETIRTKIDVIIFHSDYVVVMWQTGKRGATSRFTTVQRGNIQSFFVEKDRWLLMLQRVDVYW